MISTNVGGTRTTSGYFDPRDAAIHGLVKIVLRVTGPKEVNCGVNDAQSVLRMLENAMDENPRLAGIRALKCSVVLTKIKRGG